MAKSKASKPSSEAAETDRLSRALRAFEEGDVVRGRQLAQEVIAGNLDADPKAVARAAAKLGLDEATAPELVAQALVVRSAPPPRTFLFAAAVLTVMALLLLLARVRYGGA